MALTLPDIAALFARRGGEQYSGEPVTQLAHALQTAQRAEQDGAHDALVTAALLHDLGHLLADHGASPTLRGIDDLHQYRVLPFLRGLFGEPVLAPIRLHVQAKRWLCASRAGYQAQLSADSQRSLQLQGGVFSAEEAQAFIALPHAHDAVRLRLWDDLAKQADRPTPPLAHYLARAAACAQATIHPQDC
jgi:phosphonate degradation associated HDIG domain protein